VTTPMRMRELPTPTYVPTRVLFGEGAASCLPDALDGIGASQDGVLFVTGRRSSAKPWLSEMLARHGRSSAVLEQTESHPGIAAVERLLDAVRGHGPRAVVAVGGGSVVDSAKVVALLARSSLAVADALDGAPLPSEALPLVAIPTTSGSGSEVTSTATLWERDAGRKRSLETPRLFPTLAVVDPALTATLPREPLVSAGLDALVQAIEGAWAVHATSESAAYGLRATALARAALPTARRDADEEARRTLALGSLYAGYAIARSGTTACHALSYPLTLLYGVPHGVACALTLGAVLEYNEGVSPADCRHPQGARHVRGTLTWIRQALRLPTRGPAAPTLDGLLRALGCAPLAARPEIDPRAVAAAAMGSSRLANNPRVIDEEDAAALLVPGAGAEVWEQPLESARS
jgi:alcohol dehydrogenase class IV